MITDQNNRRSSVPWVSQNALKGAPEQKKTNFSPKFDTPILSLGLLHLSKRISLITATIIVKYIWEAVPSHSNKLTWIQ